MQNRVMLFFSRLRRALWLKPVTYCLAAVLAVLLARMADGIDAPEWLPDLSEGTLEALMSILATTMLSVATFAVGAMVGAYASAGDNATPRAFELIVSDNLSKTALSSFIGAFIFAVVGTIALETEIYDQTGRFVLFLFTLGVIGWVILTFVRWIDDIARLGRMQTTVDRAEDAARNCLENRRKHRFLGGRDAETAPPLPGAELHADKIGYVQLVEMRELQAVAEAADLLVVVESLPGSFVTPNRPLARLIGGSALTREQVKTLRDAFAIGDHRTFATDPRYGLIVLSEIGQRALSPGVNDPGTAIVIIGRLVRLLALWLAPGAEPEAQEPEYDRVFVPGLELGDLFDDAFTGLARDGAANAQFGLRLQKAYASLAALGDAEAKLQAKRHARHALRHAEAAIRVAEDLEPLRAVARDFGAESAAPGAAAVPQP
jgi:uncharacterized membrane protein